jgi:hypothetical protein
MTPKAVKANRSSLSFCVKDMSKLQEVCRGRHLEPPSRSIHPFSHPLLERWWENTWGLPGDWP